MDSKQTRRTAPAALLPSGIVAASLQDLMDTLTAYAEVVGYLLKSPTFLPQPGEGWVLSGIDLRVRMGMFEEESTPVAPARNIKTSGGFFPLPICFI